MARRTFTEKQKLEFIYCFITSGLSHREFTKKHRLNNTSLYRWREWYFTEPARQNVENTIMQRVNNTIRAVSEEKALVKLTGYMEKYFWIQSLNNRIGELFSTQKNQEKAGRYWFFKASKNEYEQNCVEKYCQSKGNDLVQVCRELIGHYYRSPKYLNLLAKQELWWMMQQIIERNGVLPGYTHNYYHHLKTLSLPQRPPSHEWQTNLETILFQN